MAESKRFLRKSSEIWNQIENDPAWSGSFRETQVNAWLAGDFARKHSDLLPKGVMEPRVSFGDGQIALAFQMQRGILKSVITVHGRVWLAEPNYIAVELHGAQAGLVPVPVSIVVRTVSSAARSAKIDLEWKQHEGRPVALLRLTGPGNQGGISFDRIEVEDGLLSVVGRSHTHKSTSEGRLTSSGSEETGVSRNVQKPDMSLKR